MPAHIALSAALALAGSITPWGATPRRARPCKPQDRRADPDKKRRRRQAREARRRNR
jgi:hypothetical protein